MIKVSYYPDMPFSLDLLLSNGIMAHKEAVAELSGIASGEAQLEDTLEKIKLVRNRQTDRQTGRQAGVIGEVESSSKEI